MPAADRSQGGSEENFVTMQQRVNDILKTVTFLLTEMVVLTKQLEEEQVVARYGEQRLAEWIFRLE